MKKEIKFTTRYFIMKSNRSYDACKNFSTETLAHAHANTLQLKDYTIMSVIIKTK